MGGGVDPVSITLMVAEERTASGADAAIRTVQEYADSHPDVPWILGGGWTISDFPGGLPDRHRLDRVTGDRPAFLTNRDGHGAWVNSAALRQAGLTADTPDPV